MKDEGQKGDFNKQPKNGENVFKKWCHPLKFFDREDRIPVFLYVEHSQLLFEE